MNKKYQFQCAVVIATKNRAELLSQRSIPSVLKQTHQPDYLIVVDDSDPIVRCTNKTNISSLHLPSCNVSYLENSRTPGASGAWNTAIDCLFNTVNNPSVLYVAFLDDDDSWEPVYLEKCLDFAANKNMDMVAAGICRKELTDSHGVSQYAPEVLSANDFLTGNPGIQGSNLFLKLNVLLMAGGFDEALPSSTDRDLCIRLVDLGIVRYQAINSILVNHFAEANRQRLSTPTSQAKRNGLNAFWQKYASRMSLNQRMSFTKRAKQLFNWQPSPDFYAVEKHNFVAKEGRSLVLGLLVDSGLTDELDTVVNALINCKDPTLFALDVVVVDRNQDSNIYLIESKVIYPLRDAGFGCYHLLNADLKVSDKLSPNRSDILTTLTTYIEKMRTGCISWLAALENVQSSCLVKSDQIDDVLFWLQASRIDHGKLASAADSSSHIPPEKIEELISRQRVENAQYRIESCFSVFDLWILGSGSEAVVFTDGITVFKCIDYWNTRMSKDQLDFLQDQVNKWKNTPGLYEIDSLIIDGSYVIITYDFEVSRPYTGKFEEEMLQLLISCKDKSIVCNNIHPKNLVVAESGVKLIDYGSDIRPWTRLGFEHMARRVFLTIHYAWRHDLKQLMTMVLTDCDIPEMSGYIQFREKLNNTISLHETLQKEYFSERFIDFDSEAFPLLVGIISSEPAMIKPLLDGLLKLSCSPIVSRLIVTVLDNGSDQIQLASVISNIRKLGLHVAIISRAQQIDDAFNGAFGSSFSLRGNTQVGIAQARTMIQRYVGELQRTYKNSYVWLLDDDMRIDYRAAEYLQWLPKMAEQSIDVLIGQYEGSSPNPPLNGIRVQLVDIYHNLLWLQNMNPDDLLPDRSSENAVFRESYPDYYYDLSRKHAAHLEKPYWLEPVATGETVREAYARLLSDSIAMLSGFPLTRPIVTAATADPLGTLKASVNRGGNTFVLNHEALTDTPNSIPLMNGREARRSDMIWAIVNRYYRKLNIQAVQFPVYHVGRISTVPDLNIEKVQSEITGSSLYAGITEFLSHNPSHQLNFSDSDLTEISRLIDHHLLQRLGLLEQSFYRITGLESTIRNIAQQGDLDEFLVYLNSWFTADNYQKIRDSVLEVSNDSVIVFLSSLTQTAEDYATGSADISFIKKQLQSIPKMQKVFA